MFWRALGEVHTAAVATGESDGSLEPLIDFYENGFPAFRNAVMWFNKSATAALVASAATVLCGHAIE